MNYMLYVFEKKNPDGINLNSRYYIAFNPYALPGHDECTGNKHFRRPINRCTLVYTASHRTSGSTVEFDSQTFLPTTTCGKPVAPHYWKRSEVGGIRWGWAGFWNDYSSSPARARDKANKGFQADFKLATKTHRNTRIIIIIVVVVVSVPSNTNIFVCYFDHIKRNLMVTN